MYFEVVRQGLIQYVDPPQMVLAEGDVVVRRVGCGICRSDVGVFDGRESIPSGMFGHESFGVVEETHSERFKEGDYVASYWHPGYADRYVAHEDKCVPIPNLDNKWAIVQPLASVLNAYDFAEGETLVVGRGFTASLLRAVRHYRTGVELHFMDEVEPGEGNQFSCCIEMAGSGLLPMEWFTDEAKIIWFSTLQEPVTTNLFEFSWKAMTVVFPSPRQAVMWRNMAIAVELLHSFEPQITHVFDFSEAQRAFEIASTRQEGYLKGVFRDVQYN